MFIHYKKISKFAALTTKQLIYILKFYYLL